MPNSMSTGEFASLESPSLGGGDSHSNSGLGNKQDHLASGVTSTLTRMTGRRQKLPAIKPDTTGLNLWNLLCKNIGKDLSKISMPVTLNEPLSVLQRYKKLIQLGRSILTVDLFFFDFFARFF